MLDFDGFFVMVIVEIDVNFDLVYGLIIDLLILVLLVEEVVVMQLCKGDDVCKGVVFVGCNENGGWCWIMMCIVIDVDFGWVFVFDVWFGIILILCW